MDLPLIMGDFFVIPSKEARMVNIPQESCLVVIFSSDPFVKAEIMVTLFPQVKIWKEDISPVSLYTPMMVDFTNSTMVYLH